MSANLASFLAAFAGSAVESVEALTIVLAVGLTRGWRSALSGAAAAVVALVVIGVGLGALISTRVPESALKLVIGTLLVLFGFRWLQKAVLRSAGVIALHDEAAEFAETRARLSRGGVRERVRGTDWPAFLTAFQGTFLEGVEVAFLVVAVGSGDRSLAWASAGAGAAVVVVGLTGVAVRRPLARIPENLLKFGVGVALLSLGTFFVGEGAGVAWPGDALSLLGLVALNVAVAVGAVRIATRLRPAAPATAG